MGYQFNKLCEEADWHDPAISRIMTEELHLPDDIAERKERKHWEWAMGLYALERYGFLDSSKRALGLGCGHERFMYALANRVEHVTATDLYGETGFKDLEANADILTDAKEHAPFPYEEDRLEVRSMDARKIDYPESCFDIVFSFSSIEHFGDSDDIIRSMKEAYRVLKPGGVYFLTVDYIYREPKPHIPRQFRWRGAGEFMTQADIKEYLISPVGFKMKQKIDYRVREEEIRNVYDLIMKKSLGDGVYPHIHLKYQIPFFRKYLFTSLSLVLFK